MITKSEIIDIIKKQVRESELNNFAIMGEKDEHMWEEDVMVGFSRGDDPYYEFLKADIGEFHWSPAEAFDLGKKEKSSSKNLCVISIAFCQAQKTKELNAKETKEPTHRWLVSRSQWENVIEDISEKIVDEIESQGVKAVAIDHIREFSRARSEKYGIASKWSHRHVAFASGLGTFGLSDGLITKKGKAVRFTTIIIESDIEADVREYEKHNEWCKFMQDGSCGDCIRRCPINAITKDGHDKEACQKYILYLRDKYIEKKVIKPDDMSAGCGLCQAGVACQDRAPTL